MKKRNLREWKAYDYSTAFEREETIERLLHGAVEEKRTTEKYWEKMRRYYDGKHDIYNTLSCFSAGKNLPWIPAQSTDGFIHVETQIIPSIPGFEFSGRDKSDYDKAKQREKVVKYICDRAEFDFKNSRNERNLNILGSAVWKVCWDAGASFGENEGDVSVLTPKPSEIFPDPAAKSVDECEYIGYVYKMNMSKVNRLFADDFKATGTTLCDYISENSFSTFDYDCNDELDSVTVTEWWFRQPTDGKAKVKRIVGGIEKTFNYEWRAGDIALSVLIGGKEIRYIPKYWRKTSFNNYPFVIYSKIPNDISVWGKSELEFIIPLIDAKDRELSFAQFNSAFSSNDIILLEENALVDGENLDNSPGAVWKLRPGMMGKVSRLGNMASLSANLYTNTEYYNSLIENTTGNYEISWGKEPTNVTTATGIALLNEKSESRRTQKNLDRNAGFKRLYSLIDKTALEYYSDGRVVRLGAMDDDEFVYSYGGFVKKTREKYYIPEIDITVNTGSSISNSKAFTVSALTSLIDMNIHKDNYKLVKAYVQTIGIPERDEICSYLDERFGAETEGKITGEEIMKILAMTNETEDE